MTTTTGDPIRVNSPFGFGNPYRDEFERLGCGITYEEYARIPRFDVERAAALYTHRDRLVSTYAWAVPNAAALAAIAARGPVVEIGAGLGYWARLLAGAGANIVAYDTLLPGDPDWHQNWTRETSYVPIARGGPERAAEHPDRALFLCWPPYWERLARDALAAYRGDTVCFIGEGPGGCTADDRFFCNLERDWKIDQTVKIPKYHWIHDELTIWVRKPQ